MVTPVTPSPWSQQTAAPSLSTGIKIAVCLHELRYVYMLFIDRVHTDLGVLLKRNPKIKALYCFLPPWTDSVDLQEATGSCPRGMKAGPSLFSLYTHASPPPLITAACDASFRNGYGPAQNIVNEKRCSFFQMMSKPALVSLCSSLS